jgi:hypothetical protein
LSIANEEASLDIAFSLSDVRDNYKVRYILNAYCRIFSDFIFMYQLSFVSVYMSFPCLEKVCVSYLFYAFLLIQDATLLPKWKAFQTIIFLERVSCWPYFWAMLLRHTHVQPHYTPLQIN